jgi:hypothetical protein
MQININNKIKLYPKIIWMKVSMRVLINLINVVFSINNGKIRVKLELQDIGDR